MLTYITQWCMLTVTWFGRWLSLCGYCGHRFSAVHCALELDDGAVVSEMDIHHVNVLRLSSLIVRGALTWMAGSACLATALNLISRYSSRHHSGDFTVMNLFGNKLLIYQIQIYSGLYFGSCFPICFVYWILVWLHFCRTLLKSMMRVWFVVTILCANTSNTFGNLTYISYGHMTLTILK